MVCEYVNAGWLSNIKSLTYNLFFKQLLIKYINSISSFPYKNGFISADKQNSLVYLSYYQFDMTVNAHAAKPLLK